MTDAGRGLGSALERIDGADITVESDYWVAPTFVLRLPALVTNSGRKAVTSTQDLMNVADQVR